METRLFVLENRLRQTEEALVAERRASRRTAEVAQAGVDVEEIGRVEVFSGDSDLNSRANSMPWSQWSLAVRNLPWRVQPDGDPVAAADGNKSGRSDHRRQHDADRSGETTFNTALL